MNKEFIITLPKAETNEDITTKRSLLIIGANGSGKTRLGTWIDLNSPQSAKVHRISAQKSLAMPDNTTPMSIDRAEKDLLYGYADANGTLFNYKSGHKWHGKPAISPLDDYNKLMVYLFSDNIEETAKYVTTAKKTTERVEPPVTKLDLVKKIWETILPHRELIVGGLRLQTTIKGQENATYNSSEMSDGERVIFYLIGQCLAAPEDGIIIIDEPEIHLHKSVQAPLWQEIEKLRPDCLFIYMTHDVDFAASLQDVQKIWLKSFNGTTWEWETISEVEGLPETLLIEILGSRKSVIFVEGDIGSYDVALYTALLQEFLVIPRGSCTQVIQSVKALRNNPQLHHLEIYGLIDRDRRVQKEIDALEIDNIYTLEVAEVENLFCTQEILSHVSNKLERLPENDFQTIQTFIFNKLQSEIETQVSLKVASEIKHKLNYFNEKISGKDKLQNTLSSLFSSIDVPTIYDDAYNSFLNLINEKNYKELLKIYNRKTLASQISPSLGLGKNELTELILRLVKNKENKLIRECLKPYFGKFAQFMD